MPHNTPIEFVFDVEIGLLPITPPDVSVDISCEYPFYPVAATHDVKPLATTEMYDEESDQVKIIIDYGLPNPLQ